MVRVLGSVAVMVMAMLTAFVMVTYTALVSIVVVVRRVAIIL